MQVITKEDAEAIKILVNEFLVTNIEFLKHLRLTNKKIEDGALFNELSDLLKGSLRIKDYIVNSSCEYAAQLKRRET